MKIRQKGKDFSSVISTTTGVGLLLFTLMLSSCNSEDDPKSQYNQFVLPIKNQTTPDLPLQTVDNEKLPPITKENTGTEVVKTTLTPEIAETHLASVSQEPSLNNGALKTIAPDTPLPQTTSHQYSLTDSLSPLGWSRDGTKFAYAIEQKSTDNHKQFKVYVQDLISDKIIWKISKTEATAPENVQSTPSGKPYEQKILAKFKQYNISLNHKFNLKTAPIHYNGDTFHYAITLKKDRRYPAQHHYHIILKSDNKGTKKIANILLKKQLLSDDKPLDQLRIVGHFISTNKKRIALLIRVLEQNDQGTQNLHYNIIGASLSAGKWRR